MHYIDVETLRGELLDRLYGELPFSIISSGIVVGVTLSAREYNRLKIQDECVKMYETRGADLASDVLAKLKKSE